MSNQMPARKGVMAWGIEPMEENGDEFFVLTFHHGLGEMTRLDLSAKDVQDVVKMLTKALPASSEWCEPCGFVHDGPVCVCGERLYAKGRGGNVSRWQHVHTTGLTDHVPTPSSEEER